MVYECNPARQLLSCGYIDQAKHAEPLAMSEEVGKLIGSMIQDAHRWCASVRS